MYDISTQILVKESVKNERIVIEWDEPSTTVQFDFIPVGTDCTLLVIEQSDFNATGDELVASLLDNMGGFTTVVDGCKAYLEYGINLNLIKDKYPEKVKTKG